MSTLKFEAAPLPVHTQVNADGPRKKRKRAPAQGAADDCFTCLNRNIKCDRRRPYCSQCLDVGQDCAGYKTQLTWGVGVASRGKLRGLSLPVAGTAKTTADSKTSTSRPKKRAANGSPGSTAPKSSPQSETPASTSPQTTRNDKAVFRASNVQATLSSNDGRHELHALRPLTTRGLSNQMLSPDTQATISPSSYHGTTHLSPLSMSFPQAANSSPAYERNSHLKPSPYPTPSPTGQYFQPLPSVHQIPLTPSSHPYHTQPEPHTLTQSGYPQTPQTLYTDQQEYAHYSAYASQTLIPEQMLFNTTPNTTDDDIEEIDRVFSHEGMFIDNSPSSLAIHGSLSLPLSGSSVVGKTPRMQYLIQYFSEVIAPVIVAFDSPSNPLRNQILSFAARSESLQHAISALSASNIRQRQESGTLSTGKHDGARRSSYMHQNLTNEARDDSLNLTLMERKREEALHKYAAVRKLNLELANPKSRNDDSVLATLLMLCLFHMCDSGIARFQTQFAGVKKLLNLRGNNFDGPNGNTKWMTRIFTLFDSLAATVNDREGQIDGQYIDMSAEADGQWPYETFTGIDSRLFKSMSQLGRLNILSQGKSVESKPTVTSRPVPVMPFMDSNSQFDYHNFDGNGWMRIVSDEDLFNLKTAKPSIQEQFWREWREVRQDLQTWYFDNNRFDGSDPAQPCLTPDQRFDMCNISESFRYSALLYTERLADPGLPSSDAKIQGWVQKSLYHIRQVRSDVYLLWPLFITGAECDDEQERSIIRERCLDIQKDSGFMNNTSCLTLLEKVWSRNPSMGTINGGQHSTFRFRDVMLAEGNEGEWIVV